MSWLNVTLWCNLFPIQDFGRPWKSPAPSRQLSIDRKWTQTDPTLHPESSQIDPKRNHNQPKMYPRTSGNWHRFLLFLFVPRSPFSYRFYCPGPGKTKLKQTVKTFLFATKPLGVYFETSSKHLSRLDTRCHATSGCHTQGSWRSLHPDRLAYTECSPDYHQKFKYPARLLLKTANNSTPRRI